MISRRFRLLAMLVALPLLWSSVAIASQATPSAATPVADNSCDVTLPNGEIPPGDASPDLAWFGSGATDASLWLMMTWEDGIYQTQPPHTLPNPDEYPLKLTFWRSEGSDEVTVTAQSTDGDRVPADVFAPFRGTIIPGIHPQGGAVPDLGCWTFTANDGNDTIRWTMLIGSPEDSCDITTPNGEMPPSKKMGDLDWFGSGAPDASLWLMMTWDDGTYQTQPPYTLPNPDEYPLKLTFWRGEGSGDVSVTATSTSGTSVPADVFAPFRGTVIPGLHPQGGAVPELGCWTFTATDGNDTIIWTMLVSSPYGDCPVTMPNGERPPANTGTSWYGSGLENASLWVHLNPQPFRWSPEFAPQSDGGHRIKSPFWRGEGSGQITLTGERLDQPSDFEPHIDGAWDSYPIPGFIATSILYPTEGCWELTATDGNDSLTWTVLVESPFAHCRVTSGADDDGTIPETVIPPSTRPPRADDYYGENGLYITLGDPVRYFPVEGDLVSPDGAISDKFIWYRESDAEGDLTITVENSAQWFPEEPQVSISEGYGSRGVQASMITFPGPGCWQVTGTSGDVSITFTVRYEIIPGEDWLPPE